MRNKYEKKWLLGSNSYPCTSAASGYGTFLSPPNPRFPKPDEVSLPQHLEHSIPWTVAERERLALEATACVTQAKLHLWKIHENIPLEKY